MGMSKKLNVIRFYTILAGLAMCLPSVDDLVTKNSCDWSCNAGRGAIDWKEVERKISQGELIKLKITYKQSVDPSCGSANDTLDLNNKTGEAELWFKMAPTSMGRIAFLYSSIISEEILTGRVFFKSYEAMNVSCMFKPITRPTTNRSSIFAFDLLQFVTYFVKEEANCSKRDDDFLSLIRMEKQTHLILPGSDAPYDERKLTVNDTWPVVSVLICIIIVLCSPAILLLFRPSHVTVQLTQTTQENSESARSPVEGDDINNERLTRAMQELEGTVRDDDADESSKTNREYKTDVSPNAMSGITETLDGERSTPIATSEMLGAPQRTSNSNPFRKTDSKTVYGISHGAIRPSTSDDVKETPTSENCNSRCSNSPKSPGEIAASSDTGCSSCPVSSGETAASAPLASVESLTDDEQSGENNGRVENYSSASSDTVVYMPQPDHSSSFVEDQIVSHEGNGNQCNSMIVVGQSSPVSIGSWIGNTLLLSSNGNQCHKLKMLVKFIIISFLPILLLTGFGDLLLIVLNVDHEISPYLPNHYLTSSVFIEVFTAHTGLIVLAVFTLVWHIVRSALFVYAIISECCIWKSCFVHSGHTFAFYRLRCLFRPCNECQNSPSDCPKQIEVPDNISHNFKELPGIFIKYRSCLFHCFVDYFERMKIDFGVKIILILLVIAIMILAVFWPYLLLELSLIILFLLVFTPLVDILLSTPLVCLCHVRMRAFKDERLQYKFLDFFLTVCSLIWLAIYSVHGALVVEIASAGFVHMLNGHPKKLLVSVTVVALGCLYVFSAYSCLTAQYLELVKGLFISYRKKFNELEEKGEVNKLCNFSQGKHKELIPTELFQYACEHELIKKPVRNSVAMMLLKTVVPLLLLVFVYPLIHLPRSDSASVGTAVITLLATYYYLNSRFNKEPPKFNEEDINTVIDGYITKKQ